MWVRKWLLMRNGFKEKCRGKFNAIRGQKEECGIVVFVVKSLSSQKNWWS